MEASTITVHWHDESLPIYSVHFQPQKTAATGALAAFTRTRERLATGGGDNNIRLWNIKSNHSKSAQPSSFSTEDTSSNAAVSNLASLSSFAANSAHSGAPSLEYLCTLLKHTQAVNAVRFNNDGSVLASAGDDGSLILWEKSDAMVTEFGAEEDTEAKECWTARTILRSSASEIYDLAWSPDSKYIATGSMDNVVRVYDHKGQLFQLDDHSHYVQGIAWDPQGRYLATQSADRSVNVYEFVAPKPTKDNSKHKTLEKPKLILHSTKASFTVPVAAKHEPAKPGVGGPPGLPEPKPRVGTLYHSETLQSFFRRLAFSPDGSLLLAPLGLGVGAGAAAEDPCSNAHTTYAVGHSAHALGGSTSSANLNSTLTAEDATNAVYIYTREGLGQGPVCCISGLKKPAIAIAFSPVYYKIANSKRRAGLPFDLPYKMTFAVATQDSVVVYDTDSLEPLGFASNLHYSTITDLVWDADGQSIVVSSTDGFCSNVVFKSGIFGEVHLRDEVTIDENSTAENGSSSSSMQAALHKSTETSKVVDIAEKLAEAQKIDERRIITEILNVEDNTAAIPPKHENPINTGEVKASDTSASTTSAPASKKRRVQPILIE